jgi:hypothetical protein
MSSMRQSPPFALVAELPTGVRGILDRTQLRFFTRKTFREFLAEVVLEVDTNCYADSVAFHVPKRLQGAGFGVVQVANACLRILGLLGKFVPHKTGLHCSLQFQSLDRRYRPATDEEAKAHSGGA